MDVKQQTTIKVIAAILIGIVSVFIFMIASIMLNSEAINLFGFIIFIGCIIYVLMQSQHFRNNATSRIEIGSTETENDYRIVKKISSSSIISISKIKSDYSFDQDFLYEIMPSHIRQIPLTQIIEISRGNIRVCNRTMWYIVAQIDGGTYRMDFLHNYSIWNTNFTEFLNLVHIKNPHAKITKFSIMRM